jgi:photosystem II stability/assembly factor-like uncharacterized protein
LAIWTLSFLDENTGYAGARPEENGKVYKTTNGGVTWESVLSASSSIRSLFFLNPSVGWAADDYRLIYRTTDGGLTWKVTQASCPGVPPLYLSSLYFTDPRNGWAVGFHEGALGVIVKSSDGGESWRLAYESPEYYGVMTADFSFNSVSFTDSLSGVVVGGSGTIMCTTDGGHNWHRGFEGTRRVLTDVHFVNEKVGWIVGAAGTILKTTSGGISFIDEGGGIGVPDGFALAQNYPNPFNPSTTIAYSIPGSGEYAGRGTEAKLVVYDLLGREITVLVNERKAPRSYSVDFDGSNLASGVYIYRLSAGRYVECRKMVLMK